MKLKIKDGRGELYQWDIGRKIIIEDGSNIDYLHFADLSKDDGVSYKCEVIEENGIRVCHIPNACFANGSTKLVVYSVDVDEDGMATTTTVVFPIRKRQKPSDYTASPEIIMTAEEILKKASAKADEAESYMNTSIKYAVNPVDEVISGTDKYSSLHWASKANDIYNDVVEYVGSSSDPSSALGSIDTARQSAIIEINNHVNTVKTDLKSYGENLVDDYINNTSKPSITDFIDKNLVPIQNNVLEIESNISDMKKSIIDSESNAQSYKNLASASATSASTSEANALEYKKQAEVANTNAQQALSGATTAMGDSISAKDIALQTLETIQGIENNVSLMKSSVDASEANVASMKVSVEASEANVTQMKTSVEGTKTEVEGLKGDVTNLKAQTQTIVENAKEDVTGLLDTKVNYTDSLTYEEIMATNPVPDLTNKVASASALKEIATLDLLWTNASPTSEFASQSIQFQHVNYKFLYFEFVQYAGINRYCFYLMQNSNLSAVIDTIAYSNLTIYIRGMSVLSNGVSFSDAYVSPSYGTYATNNAVLIPHRIYGVK